MCTHTFVYLYWYLLGTTVQLLDSTHTQQSTPTAYPQCRCSVAVIKDFIVPIQPLPYVHHFSSDYFLIHFESWMTPRIAHLWDVLIPGSALLVQQVCGQEMQTNSNISLSNKIKSVTTMYPVQSVSQSEARVIFDYLLLANSFINNFLLLARQEVDFLRCARFISGGTLFFCRRLTHL